MEFIYKCIHSHAHILKSATPAPLSHCFVNRVPKYYGIRKHKPHKHTSYQKVAIDFFIITHTYLHILSITTKLKYYGHWED